MRWMSSTDSGTVLVTLALLVMCGYALIWVLYVCLRYRPREWWFRLLDVNSQPRGSMLAAIGVLLRRRARAMSMAAEDWSDSVVEGGWVVEDGWVVGRQAVSRTIDSPTRSYRQLSRLGRGDLSDIHLADAGGDLAVVKISRVPRAGRLFKRERTVLDALHGGAESDFYGRFFPRPLESFRFADRPVATFVHQPGLVTANRIRDSFPAGVPPQHVAWMFNRLLEALGYAHRLGWLHGAVLPPHLLFDAEDHGLQLIGWTHATRIGCPIRVAPQAFQHWYPPECWRREAADPSTDLALAAASMVWLGGGDPLTGKLPAGMPAGLAATLKRCLADSDRPVDAWQLHEHLREVLQEDFGPPKFFHLNLSE